MKQSKASEAVLVARVRAILSGPGVTEQKMFGGTCFMLRGNMVAGTLRGELLVRVGKNANDDALARPHTKPMEMSRPAPGYVMVSAEGTKRDRDLKSWIDMALSHVTTLPPKTGATGKARPAKPKRKRTSE
jgi:TfoX/Sxy family transcriptional regulator of competence genes